MSDRRRSRRPINHAKPPRGYTTPPSWTMLHVGYCLVRAFQTLRQMPGGVGPRGVRSSWPPCWGGLWDRIEAVGANDARSDATAARVRPSAEAIRQMEKALQWATAYLIDGTDYAAEISALVQATAKTLAYGLAPDAIAERRELPTDVLLRQYRLGLNDIVLGMQADTSRYGSWIDCCRCTDANPS